MKKKELARKMRADEFEKDITRMERGMKRSRAMRVKKEGFKSERDYFENTNPFKKYD